MSEKLNRRDEQDGREIMSRLEAKKIEASVKQELRRSLNQDWIDYVRECSGHG